MQKSLIIGPYINWYGLQYIPSHKISYLEYGDTNNKNVIVCAHGLTRNAHDFDKIAEALSSQFRVISIDYPGRGSSDYFTNKKHYNYPVYVKDTLIVLKKLSINNCIWLGTSMGGIIGMVLASRYKKLIKTMILNDIGPFISSGPLIKIGQYAGQNPVFNDLASGKQHLKLIYNQFGIDREEDWDYLTQYSFVKTTDRKYKMNYDPAIVYGMKASGNKLKHVDIWKIWNKITCELLVVHGAKSEILRQETIEEMKKTKDFDLYTVDYAGHAPSLMTKDQIDYIKSWLVYRRIPTKVLIIGSGPAGLTAAIYAARAALNPILLRGMQAGGQLTITTDVENYPGFADTIQGPWLMQQMVAQAKNVGTEVVDDYVKKIDLSARPFKAYTGSGKIYHTESVIICTGAEARWLGLPSEMQFRGHGVSACATCDGFFFNNQEILVIGGGNTAVEEALYLTKHARKVTLIHRRDKLRAEQILQSRLFKNPKISIIWNHKLISILGTDNPKLVTGAKIENTQTGEVTTLNCSGVFIAIGHAPNTALFKGQVEMDKDNYIITKPGSTETSVRGVFAAGDVQDKIYRQAVTAAGTGCMAALEVEKFLASD